MHKELLYSKLLVESVRSKSTGEFHYVYVVISEEKPNYFYVGKHSTDNINDTYLGSGVFLKKAIKKYGYINFKKEILYVFDNKKDMITKEKEIVNEDFILRKDTYNMSKGGYGLSTLSSEKRKIAIEKMKTTKQSQDLKSISDKLTIQNSYSDAILRYDYWEVLPANALAKLEMQFTVERMNDFDEDTGTIIAYRLTPKRPTGDIFDRNAGITAGLNDINENELMERVYKKLKEITGAYGGDDMGAEDGSSYVNN
jgi:hypothetical protein